MVDVLANDTDANGNLDPGSLSVTGAPTSGTAVVSAGDTITYTPDPGTSGVDSFQYEVCDLTALCDTATATIAITSLVEP